MIFVSGRTGALLLVMCVAGAGNAAGATATGPATARRPASRPAPAAAAKSQKVGFATEEKNPVSLTATYTSPAKAAAPAPMAILVHDFDEDRLSMAPLAGQLAVAGFAVLALDMRGHGDSVAGGESEREKPDRDEIRKWPTDIEAAYIWLSRQSQVDPARFIIVGAGAGAAAAIDYTAKDPSVDAIIVANPRPADLPKTCPATAAKCIGRKLLVVSDVEDKPAMEPLTKALPGSTTMVLPAAAGQDQHGARMFAAAGEIQSALLRFAVESVGLPSKEQVVGSFKGTVYYQPGSREAARLSASNLRHFSSPTEAEARGYHAPRGRSSKARAK